MALCLAAVCSAALAESVPSAEVEVRFDFIEPNQGLPVALQLAGTLRLRQPADRTVERTLPFHVGTPIVIRLPSGTAWEASVDLAGHWARREVVEIPANGAGGPVTRRFRLWPLGSIQGIVRAAARTPPLPRVVVVTTLPARAGAGDGPPGSIACPIDAKGAWKCELPTVKYDLVIAAQGFVPHYRWAVTVPSDRPLSLGVIELKPGASVAGWVEVPDGSIDPARCRARLAPAMAPGASGQENAQRVLQTASEVQVGKEGFFQIGGLRAGSYSLVVEQPGYAPGKTAPIQVSEAQETFLREPLVLRRKLCLELSIDPALDWLDRPWRVAILRQPHSTSTLKYATVFDGSAGPLGRVVLPNQAPGGFWIRVADSLGSWLYSDHLEVPGPDDFVRKLSIRFITVHGSVALGKEPLAAALWFGGRRGETAVRMDSSAEGSFHGVLPKDGTWHVEVVAAHPRLVDTEIETEVTPDGQGRAELAIKLPDTHVFGQVLAADGDNPAVAATVFEVSDADGRGSQVSSGDRGEFEFRGFAPGVIHLVATAAGNAGMSDRVEVSAGEDQSIGPIDLRLQRTKAVNGRVSSVQGPVGGANVQVISLRPDQIYASPAKTDPDGAFTVKVPSKTETALVVVSPPGNGLRAFAVALDGTPLDLPVSGDVGDLDVTLSPEQLTGKGMTLSIAQNGLPLPLPVLSQWASFSGHELMAVAGHLQVPSLAPGTYQVCLVPVSTQRQSSAVTDLTSCRNGALTGGSTLSLSFDR